MKRLLSIVCILLFSCKLLMAASVTYTVTGRTSVSSEGEAPIGSYAEYNQGGSRKSQLTAGTQATLSIYGFDGYVVSDITLSMRSNQSSGAGSLTLNIGEQTVLSIQDASFSSDQWYGQYSSNYVDITRTLEHAFVSAGQVLTLELTASENSLYLESVSLSFREQPKECYTVSFDTHFYLSVPAERESYPGSGVCLPVGNDRDTTWLFVGWTEHTVDYCEDTPPQYYKAGDLFYPTANITLHALYSNLPLASDQRRIYQITTFDDGMYVIGSTRCDALMEGASSKAHLDAYLMPTTDVDADNGLYYLSSDNYYSDCIYLVSFLEDSLASIYNLQTDNYVSPPSAGSSNFRTESDTWSWRELADHSVIFYYTYPDSRTRILYGGYGTSAGTLDRIFFTANIFNISSFRDRGLCLFPAFQAIQTRFFTSFPTSAAVEPLTDKHSDISIQGNTILNPNHKTVAVFDLAGRLLVSSTRQAITIPLKGEFIVSSHDFAIKVSVR